MCVTISVVKHITINRCNRNTYDMLSSGAGGPTNWTLGPKENLEWVSNNSLVVLRI